jgi:hypothetical protein
MVLTSLAARSVWAWETISSPPNLLPTCCRDSKAKTNLLFRALPFRDTADAVLMQAALVATLTALEAETTTKAPAVQVLSMILTLLASTLTITAGMP